MNMKVRKGEISGTIFAPSSKSFTQRYILYSAFSNKPIKINNVSFSDDEIISIKIAETCNASIVYDKKSIRIKPDFRCPDGIYVGESGTSYRLSLGLLAARKCHTLITGEPQLARRPVETLINALSEAGSHFNRCEDGFYRLDAGNSSNRPVGIDGSTSSQFISAMLYYYSILGSGKFAAGNMVSEDYVKITESCLLNFGVTVHRDGNNYSITTGNYDIKDVDIEGDYSSASYFMVLGIFSGNIKIKNLNENSLQPDRIVVDLLRRATGSIDFHNGELNVEKADHMDEIIVDASVSPDIAPIISVIGIFSPEGVKIYNYHRLKTKESDRWKGIIDMCRAFGASVVTNEESIIIKRDSIKDPGSIAFTDHRMIMSAIIAGIIAESHTEYVNVEKINKSYPEFLNDIKRVGIDIYFDVDLYH